MLAGDENAAAVEVVGVVLVKSGWHGILKSSEHLSLVLLVRYEDATLIRVLPEPLSDLSGLT